MRQVAACCGETDPPGRTDTGHRVSVSEASCPERGQQDQGCRERAPSSPEPAPAGPLGDQSSRAVSCVRAAVCGSGHTPAC